MHDAMDFGVTGVFFSTHPDIYEITDMIRADEELRTHYNIYVNVPYIIKYVSMFNTMGLTGTLKTMLAGKGKAGSMKFFASGAKNLLSTDYISLAMQLVEIEVAPFHDLNVKSVLLHNSLCDLALAYEMTDVVAAFDTFVRDKLHAIPGYGTQNYPAFARFLHDAGLKESFVMTAVNKLGFYMNPGKEAYEEYFKEDDNTVLAMATLASGALKPAEAYDYLSGLGIRHVVVGLSSRAHAEETFSVIKDRIA